MHFAISLLALPIGICVAEPMFVIHSTYPTPTPPATVTDGEQLAEWESSYMSSLESAWSSYIEAEPAKHIHAALMILDYAVTATEEEIQSWATAAEEETTFVTEAPAWFSKLPKDVQSIKLEEGRVLAALIAGKEAMAPRETAKAALGVSAGVAVAAAVM